MSIAPVALIPARGGSKRLPRKNILPFFGKPMMAWTIEAALESGVFGQVVVTTDDEEIATVAESYGAAVLRRPLATSDDKAGLIDVLHHAVAHLQVVPDALCLPLGNCPLRPAEDLKRSWEVFSATRPSALLSTVDFGWTPPFRALTEGADGLSFVFGEWMKQKSQAYPPVSCPSGAIYWAQTALLAGSDTLYLPGITGFPIPWHHGIDIDTIEDFRLAECLKFALDKGFDFAKGAQ